MTVVPPIFLCFSFSFCSSFFNWRGGSVGKEIPETSKDSKVKMVNLVSHFHRLLVVSIQRVMAGRYSGITYSSYTPPTLVGFIPNFKPL